MPGKPPYSHAGGGDPAQNVRDRHFPYGFEKRGVAVPDGQWRFIWSHFPHYLKQKFHEVFVENARPSVDEWLETLELYRGHLRSEYLSLEIFPTGFKRLTREQVDRHGGSWLTCEKCGAEYGEMHAPIPGKPSLCPDCRDEAFHAAAFRGNCIDCGNPFEITSREADYYKKKGLSLPKRCKACRGNKGDATTGVRAVCVDCGKPFQITVGQQASFRKKGLSPPKRCEACRRAEKILRQERDPGRPRGFPPRTGQAGRCPNRLRGAFGTGYLAANAAFLPFFSGGV